MSAKLHQPDSNWQNQRVFLTGAKGQVGHELKQRLSGHCELLATDLNADEDQQIVALDLSSASALQQAVLEFKPTIILNPGAYTAVDKAESEADIARAVNVDAAATLAKLAAELGATIVHYSTDYVFNGSGETPWREDDETGPLSVYGETKLAGETAIRAATQRHLIFRTSWVFSNHGHNFVKTMLRLAGERSELNIVADQIGAPTSAATLAECTLHALSCNLTDPSQAKFGTFHLANNGETSWHGFAKAIFDEARALGWQLKIEQVGEIATTDYPTPAQRPLNSRLNCKKFEQSFAIEIPTWQAALNRAMQKIPRP